MLIKKETSRSILLFCLNFEACKTSLISADIFLISTTQTGQAHFCVYFSVLVLVHMHVGTV